MQVRSGGPGDAGKSEALDVLEALRLRRPWRPEDLERWR